MSSLIKTQVKGASRKKGKLDLKAEDARVKTGWPVICCKRIETGYLGICSKLRLAPAD